MVCLKIGHCFMYLDSFYNFWYGTESFQFYEDRRDIEIWTLDELVYFY